MSSRLLILLVVLLNGIGTLGAAPPNIVLIFCDNLGNGDIACFNPATKHRTPNLDRMAAEGQRFTSFYAASGVCSPSRAALMTGCYPLRTGMHLSYENLPVLKPVDKKGLNPAEETLAEILKKTGYDTLCLGKWHLGDQPEFLPTRQGFDRFFGIPYSEDMTARTVLGRPWPELPLLRDEKVIEAPVEARHLTKRLTAEAVKFIAQRREHPFFLYFAETGPGSLRDPFPGPDFAGRSANGPYGDAIEELDWSAGEVLKAIKDSGLDDHTLVIWTADNGATRRDPQLGSNAPYRGFLGDCSEGAMRVPCVMRWPGKIPAGKTQDALCSTLDLLPTFAALAGAPLPAKAIDGRDIRPILFSEPGAKSHWDDDGFGFYRRDQLQAVCAGPWKLYLPLEKKFIDNTGKPAPQPSPAALHDVRADPHEDHEISAAHPDVVKRLMALAETLRAEVGDTGRPGRGQRQPGFANEPKPLVP